MPVLNFVALTGKNLFYYKGNWVVILQQKHKWFYHHQGNGFYWPFDQRPEWKLIPSDRVSGWWPRGNDLMTSSPEVPKSHGQTWISNNTLWFIRCSSVSGNTMHVAQISCHLLCRSPLSSQGTAMVKAFPSCLPMCFSPSLECLPLL